jgi:translation initiation factor 1A
MPVKSKKGGKNVKRGKKGGDEDKRELVFKEDGQEYAQVVRMLGNCRLEAFCFDGTTRLAHIRGKMRKKLWVNAGDIVLIGLREYQDAKCDVIHKYKVFKSSNLNLTISRDLCYFRSFTLFVLYQDDEARNLKAYGELPETARINETAVDMANEDEADGSCAFEFDEI